MSHHIPDILRSFLTHWPGLLLIALSAATLAAVVVIGFALVLPKRTGGADTVAGARKFLHFISTVAPTVGLLGTIYGLLSSLLSAHPEEIPHFVGIALQTTYFGGILFLVCVFVENLAGYLTGPRRMQGSSEGAPGE